MDGPNAKDYLLIDLCRSYIATLFLMSLGGHEFDDYSMVARLDRLRVELHNSIETFFDIKHDSDDEKKLNITLHSLQISIGFPIPEYQGYGECTLTRKELKERFVELKEEYGMKLAKTLKEHFGQVK